MNAPKPQSGATYEPWWKRVWSSAVRWLRLVLPSRSRQQDSPPGLGARPSRVLPWRNQGHDYSGSIARGIRLAAQRIQALESDSGKAQSILSLPPERRRMLVGNSNRLQTARTCTTILDSVPEAWQEDLDDAQSLVELALDLVPALDRDHSGQALAHDIEARALAYRGNIRRIRGDHSSAERDFEHSAALLLAGTGDPMLRAEAASLVASLRLAQRRLDEALALADKAYSVSVQILEDRRAARALLQRATILEHQDQLSEAMDSLAKATELIDPSEDPHLALLAAHNLAALKTQLGHLLEAQALLARHRKLYETHGNPRMRLRRRWVEGRISRGTGQASLAEKQFLEARQGFAELELPYPMALVTLDLALIFIEQGRTTEVMELAGQMVQIFRSRGVHRETLAAAILFEQASQAQAVNRQWVRSFASYLSEAQGKPGQRFKPQNR